MTCYAGTTKFRIGSTGSNELTANTDNIEICKATKILEQLHKDFTEKYTTANAASHSTKPSFYLRNHEHTSGQPTNKFYTIFTKKTDTDDEYKKAVSVIMKGVEDTGRDTYMSIPSSITTTLKDFNSPEEFKGIYGLNRVNELLEKQIAEKVGALRGTSANTNAYAEAAKFEERNTIKATYEEIARRENQIYREKFLNLILMVVGVFIISTQLVKKYFSFEGGGGGGGGGGFFTGFGTSGSGLFSRFGGLGLGSSGRSRVGQLFSNNPYSLSQR